MKKLGFVYIVSSKANTALYVGVTSDLCRRIEQHRFKVYPQSFTARYNCTKLVFYKCFDWIGDAIAEEKRIKGGSRLKKIKMIEEMNPEWRDLFDMLE